MRIALSTLGLALVLAGTPSAQALSVTSVIRDIATVTESAIRLIEAVISIQGSSKDPSSQVKLSAVVDLVEWHRIERGTYRGQNHLLARRYVFDCGTGIQRFTTLEDAGGKVRISSSPFATSPLEIRKFQCAQPISSDPALKTVTIEAGFTMRAAIAQLGTNGGNAAIPSQYPCTLYFDEVALPAGCGDHVSLPQERRLSVNLRLSGATYFVLRPPGGNYAYGSLPGLVLGSRNPEGAVIVIQDPNKTAYSPIQE